MATGEIKYAQTAEAAAVLVEEMDVSEDMITEVSDRSQLRKLLEKVLDNTTIVHDDGPNANLFDTRKFDQCYRVARAMAEMSILPDHLKTAGSGNNRTFLPKSQVVANCFRIVNQAVRWEMDPYAIVDETYVVGGKLGYSGKLVAGVVNSRARLLGRLHYSHDGTGDAMTVTVTGRFKDDPEQVCKVTLSVKDAKTDNQMWKKDPEQKLCYSGAIKWARRYCPEVVLGVLTDDDVDKIVYGDTPTPTVEVKSVSQLTDVVKAKTEALKKPTGDGTMFDKGHADATEA